MTDPAVVLVFCSFVFFFFLFPDRMYMYMRARACMYVCETIAIVSSRHLGKKLVLTTITTTTMTTIADGDYQRAEIFNTRPNNAHDRCFFGLGSLAAAIDSKSILLGKLDLLPLVLGLARRSEFERTFLKN